MHQQATLRPDNASARSGDGGNNVPSPLASRPDTESPHSSEDSLGFVHLAANNIEARENEAASKFAAGTCAIV